MAQAYATKLAFGGNDTTVAIPNPCVFYGFLLGCDGAYDPQVTIFDSASTTTTGKTEIVPTNTYDSSALGLNGALPPVGIRCNEGITVTVAINASGDVEVTVLYG